MLLRLTLIAWFTGFVAVVVAIWVLVVVIGLAVAANSGNSLPLQ